MINLRISTGTISALDRRQKEVRELIGNLHDRRQVLEEIVEDQANRWAEDFLAEGDPSWQETSKFQQKRRIKQGFEPTPTLLRSGETFEHFEEQNRDPRINAASVTWNFQNIEGAYTVSHHTGFDLGSSTVPARTLWSIPPEDEEAMADRIEEFVEKQITNALG